MYRNMQTRLLVYVIVQLQQQFQTNYVDSKIFAGASMMVN